GLTRLSMVQPEKWMGASRAAMTLRKKDAGDIPRLFSFSPARLVVVARDAFGLVDLLILDRILQLHAGAHLADMGALDFLPGGLGGGIFVTTRRFQLLAALGELFIADQDIGGALSQVDAHPIVGLEEGQAAAGGGFG